MAARGRGGRGGRGNSARSLNREQLALIGISNREQAPDSVSQPPSLFPLLESRPVPLTQSADMDFLLIVKEDLLDNMQLLFDSSLQISDEIFRRPQRIQPSRSFFENIDWSLFPSELAPIGARKTVKVKKEVNIEERLNYLEKLEAQTEFSVKTEIKEEEQEEEEERLEDGEEEVEDEEMDDGTDYANNFFDNGEDYEDEDDNMDEGAIY